MKDAVGYSRVSTREQGRSGLGLEAQRRDVEAFGGREGFSINLGTKTSKPVPERMHFCCVQDLRRLSRRPAHLSVR